MASYAPRIDALEKLTEKHDKFINGNGDPGAKTRLNALENNDKNIIQKIDDVKKSLDSLQKLIISLALTLFGAGVGLAIWFFTELLPKIQLK